MFKKIALSVVVLVLLVLAYAATRPDSYRVQRSVAIKAPPAAVMALISDFHQWPLWSPWEKLDPAMTRTYGGAPRDMGAVYSWSGNDKVGAGRMEITGMNAASNVTIKLDFLRPFESHNVTEFVLAPDGETTTVTWAMYGPSSYLTKLMSLVASMDSMIGGDFERGLARLKAAAEQGAHI
ncbi:SRPBCC family protein [Rugamonas sp.]|uniref:SRPBCC family protein n=1 Tax=Rugamonas sp. TaxID=1926287 RepID=UPI0025E2DB40|nr:SRPBCC family protein [Rugamonas sp.]